MVDASSGLSWGDGEGPKLQLDELLAQLIDRAQDVRAAQNRLRGLLRANHAVIGDLALSALLRRIVEAACELVAAPYGALGVIAPDGSGLEEFIHVGMAEDAVETIGHLPEGKGLLGALIEDPRAIRLRDIRDDIRSVGFPDGHPPMRGFLGVPIRVREEVFGNLYLASLGQTDFTAEDEELVSALAATAGVAIENARLFEEAQRRQVWLHASTEVTRQLLTAEGTDALGLIGQQVAELASADIVTVILPAPDAAHLRVEVAVGRNADRFTGYTYPVQGTLSERVFETAQPALVEDAATLQRDEGRVVHLSDFVPVGPVMALPLAGAHGVRGILMVGRLQGKRPFTAADLDMGTSFAYHASVALELAEGRREAQRMSTFEDRARIARDLHDHVIQQLFAAGMSLQGSMTTLGDSPAVARIEGVVDTIDDAIRQIRTSIFQLRPRALLGVGVRNAVLGVVAEITSTLGYDPSVHFSGPVDAVSNADLIEDVSAVVREILSNAGRHAQATRVVLTIQASGPQLSVTVEDDGVGMPQTGRRSGLANLHARAEARGGTLHIGSPDTGRGTVVTWTVPVSQSSHDSS